jgi:transcriptional regulator with XRE-family HTH domain
MGIDYLNKVKKDKGMTAEDLSNRSGVPLSTLNKILSGQTSDPKFETLKAICNALGISLAELDDYEKEKDELTEYLDELHKRPEMKMLFKVAKKASKEDVEKAVKIIEMFKGSSSDEDDL